MKYIKIYKVSIFMFLPFLLHSCFVAKEYERPEVSTNTLYRTEEDVQDDHTEKDSLSLSEISWEKLFSDPILQNYINQGLQNNFDIRIAAEAIKVSEASLKQAKANYLPDFNIGLNWTHQELGQNNQFVPLITRAFDQYELAGNLSWEADIWGRIKSTKRAMNADYLKTIALNQAVKTELIANIAATYFSLLSLDEQLKIAEKTLLNREYSIEVIQALKDAGTVNEVAVKQTEAQWYATQIIVEDLKINIMLFENTLSALLGKAPQKLQRNTFDEQVLKTDFNLGVPAQLLSKRPDVVAAEYELISKFELTNVARSNFYPALRLTASGGFRSVIFQEWFSANSLFATLFAGLTQPLFNKRQIRTQQEIAVANKEVAFLRFESALINAGKEVSDALFLYQNETSKIKIREKQVESLKNAADYSDELLVYGMVNYLEVLVAKDAALNAELDFVKNKYQQFNAVIALYKALGGGW